MSSIVPEGWQISSIEDLLTPNCLFSDGDWVESKDQDPAGTNRLLQLADIGDGLFVNKSNRFMNDEQFNRLNCTQLQEGDVLIARMPEPIGRACILPRLENRLATVVDIAILRPSAVDSYWLMSVINSAGFRTKIEEQSSGTTRTRIGRTALSKIKLLSPPLPEQKKIASILTSVDEVIENTQKQIDKLQDLKKATMNELLTKGIEHTEFKDSELGRIPKSWEVMRMRSIAQVIDSLHETPTFSDSGIPMVRVTDIKRGELSVDNAKTVSEQDYRKFIKKYKPQLGDIVMSRVGSYGVSSYVSSDKPFCMGQNTVIINPVDINGRFLYECLESDCIQRQIELEVAGSGYKSLSLADIRALAIPVPPMHEQERIRGLLSSIDGRVIVQKQKLSQTQSLKKSLMQDLLTGKVRVTVN